MLILQLVFLSWGNADFCWPFKIFWKLRKLKQNINNTND